MSQLAISLIGPLRVTLDGEPVAGFESDKVRALLAYLAVEAGVPHRREKLAGLLWPEQPEPSARANLRHVLASLRKALEDGARSGDGVGMPPFLHVSRQTIQFNRSSDAWVDVSAFSELLEPKPPEHKPTIHQLEEALELVHGAFLEGFSLPGCPAFEEWALLEGERLRRLAMEALEHLSDRYQKQGDVERALAYAWRQVELEPWREEAHQQVMRLLAFGGKRGAALAQYESCRRVLLEELGVEPGAETTQLYEQIRDGELEVPAVAPALIREQEGAVRLPGFLAADAGAVEPPVFVAREGELARLEGLLELALAGQGRVVFVTGGPGRGKTALLAEFARRAMEARADLLVASGSCNSFSGVGDPYLPFREVMGMLTGDVEAKWTTGAISRDHALSLWGALPLVVQALLEHGPHVVPALVPGPALLSRARAVAPARAPWLQRLQERVARPPAASEGLEQSSLFQQVSNVLRHLAEAHPLLLIVDDLQWADSASIGLLFHLGRRLEGSRILIACAYRAEEVVLDQDVAGLGEGPLHSLGNVLAEFKRLQGDVWVDLAEVQEQEGLQFVDALLETEPNRLGDDFRRALFAHAGGHPLFTIELLRAMQDQGDLVRDEQGYWLTSPALDWDTLPARVEGVIEARVGRLDRSLREFLSVASVEGEEFTAQVVAQVQEVGERQALRDLSQLEGRHHLVREREGTRVAGQLLSRYQFSHILFQRYLYGQLSAAERRLLHREVADILEDLYQGRTGEIAVQLARHYAEAEEGEKAVEYLLQAGDQARGLYAYQEAIDYYQRALAFLKEQREHGRAARTLMKLGLTYHLALDFPRTRQAYEEGFVLWQRAGEIQEKVPPPPAPHALRVGFGSPPALDPTMTADVFAIAVIEQLFSGLAERTSALGVVPDVAQSWEVSEGGRKYVFHLREDARWSDGTPVTAGDFEYTWKRALDPDTRSPVAFLMDDVKGARAYHQDRTSDPDRVGVRALDDVTLEVELEGPTGYFPHLLTVCGSYPVPQRVVESHGEAWTDVDNIVTNGPFRLEAWQPGRSAVLARNPAYHGQFTGNVQRLEVSLLPDPFARLALYEANGLDIFHLCDLPEAEKDRAQHRHAEEYVPVPLLATHYVGFDASRPPFDDPRVRRAFILATDRDTLVDKVLRGTHFPATGGFVPPGLLGHSAGIALPYDPDGARQLLAEAGYPGGRGFPTVNLLTSHMRGSHSEYFKAHWWKNLGVEITREALEWRSYLDRLDRQPPHMFLLAHVASYPDPDGFLRISPVRRRTRWQNETYDRLVEEARRVTDQGVRIEMYQEADRILVEEAAIMPLAYGRCHWLVKPWVRRFATSTTKLWFWKDVIIDPH